MGMWEGASAFVHRLLWTLDRYNLLQVAVAAAVVLSSTKAGMHLYKRQKRNQLLQKMKARGQRAKRRINELREELKTCKINADVTTWGIQQLHAALQAGHVTATEVLRAYQAKALEVNDRTNAITDVIKSAVTRAAQLDKLPAEQRGPLHGIPISLKETCGLEGFDCTAGFGELIDIPLDKDSNLVKVLKSKGAVPFIRTNIPQGMRSYSCCNAIYGESKNPHNPERCTGGSSGGEAAMIAGQGSILGIGSDLGGSVRNPAHFCGITSLKPTAGRLGNYGNFNASTPNGQTLVLTTDGPMGRDVDTLVHLLRATMGPSLWELEPHTVPLPFNEEMFSSTRPLRIGYYVSDNITRPLPAVERAVSWAVKTLEARGHTILKFDPKSYGLDAFGAYLFKAMLADQGQGYDELLKYDNSFEPMVGFWQMGKLPDWIRFSIAKSMERNADNVTSYTLNQGQIKNVGEYFQLALDLQEFQQDYIKHWKQQELDVMICPPWPASSTKLDLIAKVVVGGTYTIIWNVMNFPAGVVPVTKVTPSDVEKALDPSTYPAKHLQEKLFQADAQGSEGLPIAVQVAGLPYKEEMVLRVMAELEAAAKSEAD
ncbi:fatty acid amide hydrolase 1 [Elysia marginata]|uniref:Fatty acid amide hydrolase 1 n=1 Tax=Elysia marginata TaxID=1093978 RepID=A0AAV4IYH5_9GAST|nr:fatty acid amide hydrolase 1 [Elysia marginata]